MGDQGPDTPGSYKGLPLRLVDNGEPVVEAVRGAVGVVCIGMSNSSQECSDYIAKLERGDLGELSDQVIVVNCAVGGNAIERWNDPTRRDVLWGSCIDQKIPAAGLDVDQVRVVYHKAADQFTTDGGEPLPTYPDPDSDYESFYANLTEFAALLPQELPAVTAVYTSSRIYGGFSTIPDARGEPLSYEEGHALNSWLADNPEAGGVWQGWGPYLWGPDCASGETNASGVCYVESDMQADGHHPAQGARDKVSAMIHARLSEHAWYRP
jgi:hypothetical protein